MNGRIVFHLTAQVPQGSNEKATGGGVMPGSGHREIKPAVHQSSIHGVVTGAPAASSAVMRRRRPRPASSPPTSALGSWTGQQIDAASARPAVSRCGVVYELQSGGADKVCSRGVRSRWLAHGQVFDTWGSTESRVLRTWHRVDMCLWAGRHRFMSPSFHAVVS